MSSYEDYDRISESYDKTRLPVGADIIRGCLLRAGKPLRHVRILDAGCGTGNYAQAIIDKVGHITAIDLNPKMLRVAEEKLAAYKERGQLDTCRAGIDALPFGEQVFDAVMINQVLHHLGDTPESGYPRHRRVFMEVHRTLRPGGILLINTCSQEQLRHGFWYYSLIPEAAQNLMGRYMPLDQIQTMLHACGFLVEEILVPLDGLLWGDTYLDPFGPLKREWRDGDSVFALVTDEELSRMAHQIKTMDRKGELHAFVREQDLQRNRAGQVTFVFARRNWQGMKRRPTWVDP
ncbi:MAG: methyltransferase domain-containing protein [Deltaproteobacteria bacterium]|nr:methyltransferase domain-containing protein [Deltaproteobacteria bacterium]